MVFTSRYLFSVQTGQKSYVEIDCWWTKLPYMQYGYHTFSLSDIISSNMKLVLIDAETNAAQNF